MANHIKYFDTIAEEKSVEKNYYWRELENFIVTLIPEHATVLEVGSGNGDLLSKLKSNKKIGVDFSPNMIDVAKNRYNDIDFRLMRAENLTFNQKFDYIIISNTIGYLDDIQIVFSNLRKISHSKTKIIVTYYNFLWQPLFAFAEFTKLRMRQPEQNWLSGDDIKNLLFLEGFDAFKDGRRTLLPFYIPGISNFINRYIAKLPIIRNLCLTDFFIAKPFQILEEKKSINELSVSVVIPARNESGNIENAIKRMPKMGSNTEIIFIEGNSTDDTWMTIQKTAKKYKSTFDIKIAQQSGKGKGDAVRKGFDIANGDILMILDADLTVPPEDLTKFYEAIVSGKGEFINGSRLVYNMDKEAMRFLNLLGNKFFSIMFTWLLDQRFKDTLCGTKVLLKSDYENLRKGRKFFGDFDPFGDFDLIFGASKLNLKIIEIPIRYKERSYGATNISRFKHGLILLKMCLFASKKIKFT